MKITYHPIVTATGLDYMGVTLPILQIVDWTAYEIDSDNPTYVWNGTAFVAAPPSVSLNMFSAGNGGYAYEIDPSNFVRGNHYIITGQATGCNASSVSDTGAGLVSLYTAGDQAVIPLNWFLRWAWGRRWNSG
jgi:hypothetical protein